MLTKIAWEMNFHAIKELMVKISVLDMDEVMKMKETKNIYSVGVNLTPHLSSNLEIQLIPHQNISQLLALSESQSC